MDIQIPTDTLKYQGCLEEPKLAILAHCAPPLGRVTALPLAPIDCDNDL